MQAQQTQFYIDFSTIPANVPSLCIPRVFSNIPDVLIRKTFDELCLGEIGQIKRIPTKDDKYKCVRIVFNKWFNNPNANLSRERLLNGKEIKVIYDEPWFWKVYAYKQPSKQTKTNNTNRVVVQEQIPIAPCLQTTTVPQIAPCLSETFYKTVPSMDSRPPIRKLEPRTPSNSPPRQRTNAKTNGRPRNNARKSEARDPKEDISTEIEEDEHTLRDYQNEKLKKMECYVEVDYGDIKIPPPRRKFKSELKR